MILRQAATLSGMALVAGALILGGGTVILRAAPQVAEALARDPVILANWTSTQAPALTQTCWPTGKPTDPGHAI